MPTLSFPTLPQRIARAAVGRVQDLVASRTAPPVVVAVRGEKLTRLTPRALADLHDRVVEAEQADRQGVIVTVGEAGGGAAIVLADARSSAREVRVYGVSGAERGPLAEALGRHGFRPEAARVTILGGLPDATGDPVAVAHVATREPEALRAVLAALAERLVVGGVIVVDGYPKRKRRAVVDEVCAGRGLNRVQRAHLHLVRETG